MTEPKKVSKVETATMPQNDLIEKGGYPAGNKAVSELPPIPSNLIQQPSPSQAQAASQSATETPPPASTDNQG